MRRDIGAGTWIGSTSWRVRSGVRLILVVDVVGVAGGAGSSEQGFTLGEERAMWRHRDGRVG